MRCEYSIEEQDFLDFQLYTASKSERINKKKRKGWTFLTMSSITVGLYFYFNGNIPMTIYFIVITLLIILFYPQYFKWRYKKHYSNYIKENYSKRFGEKEIIEFHADYIFTKDKTGEGKINISEIDETGKHFFIKISTGVSFIIPKDRIENIESLQNELNFENVKFKKDLDWKWK